MHGCSSTSVPIVNAEVDSMGRVVEGGVGIAKRTSPLKTAIEKVQAELRQEYGVRDERKRELEFLERGGNPLDFKLGNGASVSVQSTSITDLHPDQIVTSEAKGSFAFTASPHGDSVESSDRPGATPCEPNSADNLMLFDAEQEFSEGGRSFLHPRRSTVVPSDQSFHIDGNRKTQEHGDSAAFGLPRKAYKRRYRSRPNRDGARSGSTDVNPTRGYHASSIPSRHGPRDAQGLTSDTENQHISLDPKPASLIDGNLHKTVSGDGQPDMELDSLKSVESTKDLIKGVPDATLDVIAPRNSHNEQGNQQSLSGAAKTPNQIDSSRTEAIQAIEKMNSVIVGCETSATNTVENQSSSCQINGFSRNKVDEKTNDAQTRSAPCSINLLGSESFCTRTSLSIAGKSDIEMCTGTMNVDSNGNLNNPTLQVVASVIESDKFVKEKKDTAGIDSSTLVNKETASQIQQENGFRLQPEEESDRDKYAFISEVKNKEVEGVEVGGSTRSESGRKSMDPLVENTGSQIETSYDVRRQDSIDVSGSGLHDSRFLPRVSNVSIEAQTSSGPDSFASKIDEDSVLKEAQIIEAKRKRIAALSIMTNPTEIRWKFHWDYVLEEMAWLANDFAQERIWKIAAASQISFRVAVTCRLRKQEKGSGMVAKAVAHTLAKAVMEFWHAVDTGKELEQQRQKNGALSVQAYAVRFLKHNKHNVTHDQADVPLTPDRISDSGIVDQSYSWEDNLTEENLFYRVPTGAMETYRKSIESLVAQCERNGVTVQEEVETSACDAAAESQDNAFDEDEGETSTYNMSVVFEGSKSSRYGEKKRKHLTHAYGARLYEMGSNLLPMHCAENKVVTQQSALLAKRPGGSLNVSIPTKRVRTASRRVIGPFNAGASGFQLPNKTDASSGDTNSFQDDQSTLRGGLIVPNSLEVESAADFERQLPFESAEVSTKPKKKKKAKHLNAEQRWQVDSSFQNEQFPRDHLKKRSDSHQLEYNGTSGLLGQPMIKKPKIMRQSQDNSFDNMPPSGGSVPSPVASQISNMSNPNKFIKMLGGRDRGRKAKAVKMPSGHPGSGSPWSLFEDQALVVLAHDLGPNWELVSDAINSTLHFKCIFRKAKECKERHNFLMDRTSGDGADSAEDSGSSQPYPSTLPGIPKGSARQLFQRLQGPMEEDILKSHFEKIIMIGQKQHHCKTQNDNQDPRQLQQPHSSHTTAFSQLCPNNLNGGPILTPLDLCDAAISGPDMLSLGYQGPHSGVLAIPNQGTFTPMFPASGASSVLQGSPNMMIGSNLSSSPGPLNSSASKDARYVVPRSGSVSADEQQRIQPYNQMIPGRNIPQPNISRPGALPGTDRGVRILPGGNGMGMMPSVNRGMPMPRPGLQGIPSSSMVNSGSMVSPGMSSANMHAGVSAGQGSSMLRPREALHMMRPGPSQDSQRQMMVADLQMPGNSQGMSQFGGLSSPFPNQSASPPVSSYPVHHQPSHPISPQQPQVLSPHHPHFQGSATHGPSPQQQAYAIRLAKERQLQQRLLQQQPQQQFAASNSLMPHVTSQPQLPISSAMQNSSQGKAQTSSPPVSLSPLTSTPSMNSITQHQQKHQTATQGAVRNAQAVGSGLATQTSKQRQRQQHQFSQANRQHPQQRQQLQAQQQAKFAKGVGRGNLMMHHNIPTESSVLNGVSTNPGNQCSEKGEPATPLVQNQGLYTGSALNTVLPTRQYAASQSPNQSLPQQKMYSSQGSSSSKHLQMTSQSDSSCQGQVPPVAPPVPSTGPQSGPSVTIAGSNHLQAPPHQKLLNQNQSARVVQKNRQINSDQSTKPQGRDADADHHPTSSSTEMDTMTALPQTCNTATNIVQNVSPPSAHKRHASEPLLDSNALNSPANLSPSVSMPSNSSESVPQVGKGVTQRPSASLPTGTDVSVQWQKQHQSQGQQPHSPVPALQQHQQPPVHTQQQAQLLQAGNGNLYGRSNDPR